MKCLIVVDYQVDFVVGSLGFEQAKLLEERIYQKIITYLANQDVVIYTIDTHDFDYLSTQEGKKLPVLHCIKNTNGWLRYGRLANLPGIQMIKDQFGSIELFEYCQKHPFEEIELVGVVTNICVLANAVLVKTAAKETPIIIDANCTASYDQQLHEKTLDIMAGMQMQIMNRGKTNE